MTAPRHPPTQRRDEVVDGVVEEVLWSSEDGRFSVVRFSRLSRDDILVAIGDLGSVAVGETLRLHGRWSRHAVHGHRFRVHAFTPIVPNTQKGIIRYLGSGLIKGIGKGLAARLVEKFGDQTLDVIATQSRRLLEVSGIGKSRAESIATAVRERREEAEQMAFFHAVGLGPALARRVLRHYGRDATRVIREDPYLVAEEVSGIGFRKADEIGRAVGIGPEDPRRAAGAALHVLARASDRGHVFLERSQVVDEAQRLGLPPVLVDEAVDTLAGRGLVILEGDDVYPPPLHRAELSVARALATLARPRAAPEISAAMKKATEGVALSERQLEAVRTSLTSGLTVLTGGPGTGKTTTVRAIVAAQRALGRRVLLCAPTGRAAKRLSEATGAHAATIHRMLEWNPMLGGFQRDARHPLDAELILVDEASMLNLQLADSLLDAVAPSSQLILVGDVDQLPPVGPGQVLRELIASEVGALIRLEEVFRQAAQSAIVRGAHAILRGDVPASTPPGEQGPGDLFVLKARGPDRIRQLLVELLERVEQRYGIDPVSGVQVLSPMRKGHLGTEGLNELLQAELNPQAARSGGGTFFPGDKVMQLRNDYDKDVFNGDLGRVTRVQGGATFVNFDGREVQYKVDELEMLSLAYASTIHKVQGSEFPAVIVLLHGAHHVLLSRALLYTAVTRAKRLVVIVGDPQAIARAARNSLSYESNSRLGHRLRQSYAELQAP